MKYDFVCANGILMELEFDDPPGPVYSLRLGPKKTATFQREERAWRDKTWFVYREVDAQ